jgi:adenine/guanine phosphoribosyltransferase-like PRPP-binding protein
MNIQAYVPPSRVISEYLFTHGPTQTFRLEQETGLTKEQVLRVRLRQNPYICSFPHAHKNIGHFNHRYGHNIEYYVGNLANDSERFLYLPGQDVALFARIVGFLPNQEEMKSTHRKRSMESFMRPNFPPVLISLCHQHYGFIRDKYHYQRYQDIPIKQILADSLITTMNAQIMFGDVRIRPDVILTAKNNGIPFSYAAAKVLNAEVIACEKTHAGDTKISLDKKIAERLGGKNIILSDDTSASGTTLYQMTGIVESAHGEIAMMKVQVADPNCGVEHLDYLCPLSLTM